MWMNNTNDGTEWQGSQTPTFVVQQRYTQLYHKQRNPIYTPKTIERHVFSGQKFFSIYFIHFRSISFIFLQFETFYRNIRFFSCVGYLQSQYRHAYGGNVHTTLRRMMVRMTITGTS